MIELYNLEQSRICGETSGNMEWHDKENFGRAFQIYGIVGGSNDCTLDS